MNRRNFFKRAGAAAAIATLAPEALAQVKENYERKLVGEEPIFFKDPSPQPNLWTPISIEEISKERYRIKLTRTSYPLPFMMVLDHGYNFKKPVTFFVEGVVTNSEWTFVSLVHVKIMKRRLPAKGPFRAYANAMPES